MIKDMTPAGILCILVFGCIVWQNYVRNTSYRHMLKSSMTLKESSFGDAKYTGEGKILSKRFAEKNGKFESGVSVDITGDDLIDIDFIRLPDNVDVSIGSKAVIFYDTTTEKVTLGSITP